MTIIASSQVYNQFANEYDNWFEKHPNLYQSELLAMKQAVPKNKTGIEIGVGTGRFAIPLNIKFGVEPSESMAQFAKRRGVEIINAIAEDLPIENRSFDFTTMVTTICFLNDIPKAFADVHRILKPEGEFIIGLIDRNSKLGKKYERQKTTNKFYRNAHFHSTAEIKEFLSQAGFQNFTYWQTLISANGNIVEQPQPGYGKGSFVVIKGIKK